jgi:hypothetical protein
MLYIICLVQKQSCPTNYWHATRDSQSSNTNENVRGLARDCMYIEAHLIDRFEDSGMTVDIATGMPRVADKTLENFSRHLTVHQRN